MPVLENRGSTARDHLANERTLLAWVRTALGIIGLGVVFEKLIDTAGSTAVIASAVLIAYGVGILVYSLYRYERVITHLERGEFPVARRGPLLIGLLALVLALAGFVLILP